MEISERIDDMGVAFKEAVQGELRAIWKVMPVIAQSSDGHSAQAQSALSMTVHMPDGSYQQVIIPTLMDLPIHYMGGGGVTATHPVAQGDEGVVLFTDRNQDAWRAQGGQDNQTIDLRAHHLADGRYLPGGRSDPRKLDPAPSSTSHQTRSDDGNHVNDVHPQNGLTHASTVKDQIVVNGTSGTGILHSPDNTIINANGNGKGNVLIQTAKVDGHPPPGQLAIAASQLIAGLPLPASGPLASVISSALSSLVPSGGLSARRYGDTPEPLIVDPTAAANLALRTAGEDGADALYAADMGTSAATLITALTGGGGLVPALNLMVPGTSYLSGAVQAPEGNYGLTDVIQHVKDATSYFGASAPSSVDPGVVLAPLRCAPTLAAYRQTVQTIVAGVIAGTTTVNAAVTAVEAMTVFVGNLVSNANLAIITLQAIKPQLDTALQAANLSVSQNSDLASLGDLLNGASPALAEMSAAVAAIIAPTAADISAAGSFPDSNATSQGATGRL